MKKVMFISAMMLIFGVKSVYAQEEANCGTLFVPQVYDGIFNDGGNLIIVEKNGKKGVINSEGKQIVPLEYDGVEVAHGKNDCGGLIEVHKINKNADSTHGEKRKYYGLYNSDGSVLIQCDKNDYESINIQSNKGYGYEGLAEVHVFEKLEIDSIYDMVFQKQANGIDNEIDYVLKSIKYTRLTKSGVLLENGTLNTSYDDYRIYGKGLITVRKNNKEGLLNKKGEIIIPVIYDDLKPYANNMVEVKLDGKGRGLLDVKGKKIVPIGRYKSLDVNPERVIVENSNRQKGVLSLNGEVVIPMGLYDRIYEESCKNGKNHYLSVEKGGKSGAASLNGKIFVPCGKYDSFKVLDNNLTIIEMNKKKGLINRTGIVVVPVGKYSDIRYEYGVLYYSQNGKYGILDKKGKQATLAIYDVIKPERHSDGIAKVRKGEKAGVIDCEGHVIMPLGDYIDGKLHDDVGMLKSNEGTVFFLKDGKILSNYGKYEEAEKKFGALRVLKVTANEGLFVSEKNTQKGIVKLW